MCDECHLGFWGSPSPRVLPADASAAWSPCHALSLFLAKHFPRIGASTNGVASSSRAPNHTPLFF